MAALAQVEIEVQGSPKRAQLVLRRGSRTEVVRTWSDGFVTVPRVEPGEWVVTVQRAGSPTGKSRKVMFGPGKNRLVIPSSAK
jgi:hypothetical protein